MDRVVSRYAPCGIWHNRGGLTRCVNDKSFCGNCKEIASLRAELAVYKDEKEGWAVDNAALRTELKASTPGDLRAEGWMVAVHNDYNQNGERFTFWLVTRGLRCFRGEGHTDAEALNEIRAQITEIEAAREAGEGN